MPWFIAAVSLMWSVLVAVKEGGLWREVMLAAVAAGD